MKTLKVENVSGFKLDFFLKQNDNDIRVVLDSGESTWCDADSNTKSMILYERKNLIKISPDSEPTTDPETSKNVLPKHTELIAPQLISVTPNAFVDFDGGREEEIGSTEDIVKSPTINNVEEIATQTNIISTKTKKIKKGKKRGPKKKPGPKPGAAKRKKKLLEKLAKEQKNDSKNIQDKP
jgi:hypothetical protein